MKRPNTIHRWSRDEIVTLMAICRRQIGQIGGVGAAEFWTAFLRVNDDTGERCATILSLRSEWIDWDAGAIQVPGEARKDGTDLTCRLEAETLAALRAIFDSQRDLLFDVPRATFARRFNQLLLARGRGGV